MKQLLIILLLLISINCLGQERRWGNWFKPFYNDKEYVWLPMDGTTISHMVAGATIGAGTTYVFERGFKCNKAISITAGTLMGSFAGFWKEGIDPVFDKTDFTVTVVFSAVGAGLASWSTDKYTISTVPVEIDDRLVGGQLALNIKF